ncbi:uncharacterized protein UTRI_00131_B [Ustilago trichophora]|uniref:Uncharacterized protein n=1 Tax=Ustilago trichophora TaxID=86804 RepID=A0A5C3DNX1_9BASI|nr:uncharacterized protein UTRI_00131_B [Ustilago trichophora]
MAPIAFTPAAPSKAPHSNDGSTVDLSEDGYSDTTSNTEAIDGLSETGSAYGEDKNNGAGRKASPVPTVITMSSDRSSIQLTASVQGDNHDPPFIVNNTKANERGPASPRRPGRALGSKVTFLTESEKAQIVSFREAGWNARKIAEHLDRPVGTINSFIHRRRLMLAKIISGLPGSSTPTPHQQQAPKPERKGTDLAGSPCGARPAKRERSPARINEGARVAKPKKRAKREEAL